MDALIKIIAGPEKDQEFRCVGPETIVGRSPRCVIRLSSASVSYEHAIIIRAGEDFLLENLSANGTFLNNDRVTTKTRLRAKDRIRIGDETVARVESITGGGGGWGGGNSRGKVRLLAMLVVIMLVGLVILVVDPFSAGTTQKQTARAYLTLLDFTRGEIAAGRLPRETEGILEEGWRLETAGARPDARREWLRLRTMIASTDATTGYLVSANNYPRALSMLLDPNNKATLSEDELGAALVEFAAGMEKKR